MNGPQKFRKKPVVIEAAQWGTRMDKQKAVIDLLGGPKARKAGVWSYAASTGLLIHTLEGDMLVSDQDWVIKGVANEFYPCKPEIFEATYEPVES